MVPILAGCSPDRSNLAECRYEVEKLLVDYKPPQFQVESDLKVGGLIDDCMRSSMGSRLETSVSLSNEKGDRIILCIFAVDFVLPSIVLCALLFITRLFLPFFILITTSYCGQPFGILLAIK